MLPWRVKLLRALGLCLSFVWLGYTIGLQSADRAVRNAQSVARQKLDAQTRETNARIAQLERMLAAENRSEKPRVATIRDVRDIPASGFTATYRRLPDYAVRKSGCEDGQPDTTATYRGLPGYGGHWHIEPARYPPVSSMNRIGGGH